MKILERIVDSRIRQLVSIDNSQFGFVPGRGTTDAIFVVRQLQEKYLAANKRLYVAFVDLEKAFDRVPRKVIRWALRKLGVEEWIVRLVQGMYANAQSRVRVGEGYSEEFEVKVGVHQGSVLSPLLFIIHGAWSLIAWVPLWGPMRGPLRWWPCYHRWIAWGMCQEALDLERSNGEERTESKCRKDKDHDLQYGTGPPAEFRRVSMCHLSHWSGQQQHLLQWLQALGAQEMQWAQMLEKWPWLQIYTVPGNCTALKNGWQTTEGSPGRTWQAWGASFLLLPRRHALSSRWLWTLEHNMGENSLEEVQGSATSSLLIHATSLSKHVAVCTALVCGAQYSMPARLGHWQSRTSSVCSEMTGQWSDRSAYSRISHEYSSLFIIVINLIFMFSLWCIDWVGSLYANQIFMYFCIKSSIGTQGEVSYKCSCKSALNPQVVCSTDRSKAVVLVLVLLFVALWFILRGNLLYVFPCVILFLCVLVLLVLQLPRLGKRELILVLFVPLFVLCLFRFVGFLFLLGSGMGCGL